jgi:hypothetical protein
MQRWGRKMSLTVMHVARILLENPSTILPDISMAAFSAKVIRSHPVTMPTFPIMFMFRLPQMSIASPPRRQPTGLAIAYTLAETHDRT